MANRMLICGGNGAGKSTLAKALAHKLGWYYKDIEEYFFPKTNADYIYESARTKEEVTSLLLEDLKHHPNFIFAAVKGDYGEEVISMFTCTVYIRVPKQIRMKRIYERSYEQFGNRILPGNDLYEQEKSFFEMAAKRSDREVGEWLNSINIPIIPVDGTQPIEKNVEMIVQALSVLSKNVS